MTAEAYPLSWPSGWKTTAYPRRARFRVSFTTARDKLVSEIRLLGGSYVVLSTNIPLRRDGLPYAGHRQPQKPGVAVYFLRRGKSMVFACDKWDRVEDNMRAIEKTINTLRGMERWGASEMMERTINAFEALPPPQREKPHWSVVLGVSRFASEADIRRAHRAVVVGCHPDQHGNAYTERMAEANNARDEALFDIRNRK